MEPDPERLPGWQILKKREVESYKLVWYKANHSEILEGPTDWPGRYIPIVMVYGKELNIEGIFVEIGSTPNSEFIKKLVNTNQKGEIIIDHRTGATSRPGIFAAGFITDEIYKQNNISAGDGVTAALSVYNYLMNNKTWQKQK